MATRYHITIIEETDASEGQPSAVATRELLSFRTEHRPDLGALTTMLNRAPTPPRARRKDAGTTRPPKNTPTLGI